MKRLSFLIFLICLVCPAIVFSQNKALRLEGNEGHVSSDSPALNFTGDFTISARIKATSGVKLPPDSFPNSWSPIITNSGGSITENLVSKRNYTIWLNQDGYVHYTSTDEKSQRAINSPVGSISLDKWYFLSLTVTVNDKLRAYLNGKLLGETTIGTPVSGNSNFRIGWVNSVEAELFNPASFDGVIDEVRLWNVARTEAEIQSTMNSTLAGTEEGLVGYWNFDDGTAKDLTINENDGEFQGNTEILEVPLETIELGDFFDPNNLDDEAVSVLIQQLLQNPDANVRVSSVETLGRMGKGFEHPIKVNEKAEAAIPALIQALLQDEDKSVRIAVAWALGRIDTGTKDAVPNLIRALKDQDMGVRSSAAYALGRIGSGAKDAVPNLIRALKDQDMGVRSNTAWALGRIGSGAKDAVPNLIRALKDQDADVRSNTAWALGSIRLEAKDAVPDLIQALLQDESKSVRVAVVWALGSIGTPEALKAVEEYQSRR